MSILSTTINGTHTNAIQAAAIFNTRIIGPATTAIAVEITVERDGNQVDHNDFVLDSQNVAHEINMGAQSVTLSGRLKLDEADRVVVFQGNLVFPGQVNVGMAPVIVALL